MNKVTFPLILTLIVTLSCGPKENQGEKSVVQSSIKGGEVISSNHSVFPAIVKVFADDSFCSGTLIARDVVLTAAHCVVKHYYHFRQAGVIDGYEVPSMIVRVFHSDGFAKDYRTKNIIAHEEYDPNVWKTTDTPYDLALLKLEEKVDKEIAVAKVFYEDPFLLDQQHMTFGYGHFSASPSVSQKNDGELRKLKLERGDIVDIFLKFFDQRNGPCIGDSGGPSLLMKEGVAYVTGVLSFAMPDKAMTDEQRKLFVGESGNEANWDRLYRHFPDYDECAGGEFFYTSTYKMRDFIQYYLPRL